MFNIGTLARSAFGLPVLSEKEAEELLKDKDQEDVTDTGVVTDVTVKSETEVVTQPSPSVIIVGMSVVEPVSATA